MDEWYVVWLVGEHVVIGRAMSAEGVRQLAHATVEPGMWMLLDGPFETYREASLVTWWR